VDTHQSPPRERARRLAPEQRRAALLASATELFIAQGPNFTTADLAHAAGVSEGTIFRYFTDKPTLVAECRRSAMGLDELVPEILAAAELPRFEDRVLAASRLLNDRILRMVQVMTDDGGRHDHDDTGEVASQLIAAMTPVFEGVEAELGGSTEPSQLANLLLGMLMSNTFLCEKTSTEPVPVERLVEIFLHGTTIPASGGTATP
jgi:AcrR family transcriptional regulator